MVATISISMNIEQKIIAGCQPVSGKKIIHTAPHHDDILLGYFPYVQSHLVDNEHHVIYLTSGSNGVSDQFCAQQYRMSLSEFAMLDASEKNALKSKIRQTESQRKWQLFVGGQVHIMHLQASFYAATDQECIVDDDRRSADIIRLVDYYKHVQPDIITVLVDEPGCGPQSHHQSAQLVMQAIAAYQVWFVHTFGKQPDLTILGYRNIWSSFSVEQASLIIQVAEQELDCLQRIFDTCFASQHHHRILLPTDDAYDLASCTNFGQQAVLTMRQQGALVGLDAAIFLRQLKI